MEKLVRLRLEEDDSIAAANKLFDAGWVLNAVFDYKGEDHQNQYLFLLALSPEDEERQLWSPDEDDEDDEDKFRKGGK